ncbi:MAG: biphenyl 2,3-dioxygenase [Gemmataceae bacterium]
MAKQCYIPVARIEEVPEGQARVFSVEGQEIVLCKVDGKIYALANVCTHDGGPLGEGKLIGCEIECPRHGARFDVRTGAVTRMPAAYPVQTYPVRIEDGAVMVQLPTEEQASG